MSGTAAAEPEPGAGSALGRGSHGWHRAGPTPHVRGALPLMLLSLHLGIQRGRAGASPVPGCPLCPWGHSRISLGMFRHCSAAPAAPRGTGPRTLRTPSLDLFALFAPSRTCPVPEEGLGCPAAPVTPRSPSREGPGPSCAQTDVPFICSVISFCWQKRLEPVEGKLESLPGPGKRK